MKPLAHYDILVVEDDQDIQNILMDYLKFLGFNPESVSDGFAAYKKIKQKPYDLIFLDIMMPRFDGFSILEKFNEEGLKLNIIITSALNSRESVVRAKSLGVSDYVTKPFDLNDIKMKIEKILQTPIQAPERTKEPFHYNAQLEEGIIYIQFEGDMNVTNLLPLRVELPKDIELFKVSTIKLLIDLRDVNPDSVGHESLQILQEIIFRTGLQDFTNLRVITTHYTILSQIRQHEMLEHLSSYVVDNKNEGRRALLHSNFL